MRLILLGPPGSGKGTQAAKLAQTFCVPQISTGDLLREERAGATALGKQAAACMDRGELVPDDLGLQILQVRVSKPDCDKGFLLDGFPRTVPQAEALSAILEALGVQLEAVVDIEVPDGEIESRITGRRSCPVCAAIYHVVTQPPKTDGTCDRCGGALTQRSDDSAETVRNRLRVYHEQTQPLIEFYRATGCLHEIDGVGDPAAIAASIREALGA